MNRKSIHTFIHVHAMLLRTTVIIALGVLIVGIGSVFIPLPKADFDPLTIRSLRVVDRNGYVLREYLNGQQGRGEWISFEKISPWMIKATIAVEDNRFYRHPGVDPAALLRAVVANTKARRFKSGASTITQQVIRNVYHQPRTVTAKIIEAWYALRLERMFSKSEILEQYLNRAPYGNQLFGIEAASRTYFDKPARDLSLAEAAFLSAIPNAPSSLNPYGNFDGVHARQRFVLARMLGHGDITQKEFDRAVVEPIQIVPVDAAFRAPHAVEMISKHYANYPDAVTVQSTVDAALQQEIQYRVRNDLAQLKKKNVTNAAVVVLENTTGAVRVLLGSANFFDAEHQGQVNGAVALRQPGSALKPFTYATAFQKGFTPATILADIPTNIPDDRGDYVPENYDKKFHGPVRARTALACSYNVPAVRVLYSIGEETLLRVLQSAGFTSLSKNAEYYGLGLTLGNAEVSLLEITNAYRALANRGVWSPPTMVKTVKTTDGKTIGLPPMEIEQGRPCRVFDECAAFMLTDILADPDARRPAFGNALRLPFPCAVKTGTTKDYKDNWTIGYTTEYTVGVWVGNFDGTPMHGVSGVSGAGQVFIDVMTCLYSRRADLMPPDFPVPRGVVQRRVCSLSGLLPTGNCRKTILEWFPQAAVPQHSCTNHRKFLVRDNEGKQVERIFEVFPSEFDEWVSEERIPQPPPEALKAPVVKSEDSSQSKTARFSILAPGNGELFKIDPVLRSEYQSIKIIGAVPENVHDVRLKCDGKDMPYVNGGVWWQLRHGTHEFRLEGENRGQRIVSKPVRVTVE